MYGYETHINSDLPTVEWFLFKALKKVGLIEDWKDLKKYDYSKSAWTDKGVSAAGNVFAIKFFIDKK